MTDVANVRSEGTCAVGSYPRTRTAYGCEDMVGNVSEWCEDRIDAEIPDRLIRGGSWSPNAKDCRAARRYWIPPLSGYHDLGFRLARVPVGTGKKTEDTDK